MGIFDKLFGRKDKDSEVKDVGIEKVRKKPEKKSTIKPNVENLEEKNDDNITCASCKNKFTWNDAYYHQDTPGSTPYHPPGHGDYRPRVFCPHCGALVVDWHITREKDFDEWIWFGDNATLNAERSLPPSPGLGGWGEGIPIDFKPSYAEHKIDIKKIKQFNAEYEARRQKAIEKESESKEAEGIDWANITDYYHFGNSLEGKGDYKGAEKAYRLSIEINPKFMGAYNGLGFLLKSQKRYDESIETFNKAMKVDPYNLIAYNNLASLLIYLKRFEEAEGVYRKAREIAPTHPITEHIKRGLLGRDKEPEKKEATSKNINAKVDALIFKLKDPDPTVRESSVREMIALGEPAIEPLIQYLQHPDKWARLMAAAALGKMGDSRAIESLSRTRDDPDGGVRYMSQTALKELTPERRVKMQETCAHCGKEFYEPKTIMDKTNFDAMLKVRVGCSKCGTPVCFDCAATAADQRGREGDCFCPKCGANLGRGGEAGVLGEHFSGWE